MMNKCIDFLKSESVRKEITQCAQPLMEVVMTTMRPYILYIGAFLVVNFILLLSVLWYLMKLAKIKNI